VALAGHMEPLLMLFRYAQHSRAVGHLHNNGTNLGMLSLYVEDTVVFSNPTSQESRSSYDDTYSPSV
jgi:hypothetical protein